jgi:hypothetical protein
MKASVICQVADCDRPFQVEPGRMVVCPACGGVSKPSRARLAVYSDSRPSEDIGGGFGCVLFAAFLVALVLNAGGCRTRIGAWIVALFG